MNSRSGPVTGGVRWKRIRHRRFEGAVSMALRNVEYVRRPISKRHEFGKSISVEVAGSVWELSRRIRDCVAKRSVRVGQENSCLRKDVRPTIAVHVAKAD